MLHACITLKTGSAPVPIAFENISLSGCPGLTERRGTGRGGLTTGTCDGAICLGTAYMCEDPRMI